MKPRGKEFLRREASLVFVTHPHTDGGQAPARPVHEVEEQEAGHRDEVGVCRWTKDWSSLPKK